VRRQLLNKTQNRPNAATSPVGQALLLKLRPRGAPKSAASASWIVCATDSASIRVGVRSGLSETIRSPHSNTPGAHNRTHNGAKLDTSRHRDTTNPLESESRCNPFVVSRTQSWHWWDRSFALSHRLPPRCGFRCLEPVAKSDRGFRPVGDAVRALGLHEVESRTVVNEAPVLRPKENLLAEV
jgi:hypothetical protein